MNKHSSSISDSRNEDIDSKIADFMADIDEIVLGKKTNLQNPSDTSEWRECFDESSQSTYYWNTKTNECTWDPPTTNNRKNKEKPTSKRRSPITNQNESPKKVKKTNLITEYSSSEGESTDNERPVDDIDELLDEVLEKKENTIRKSPNVDVYPLFEANCRAAIARLLDFDESNKEAFILRVQLETRLDDVLAGHLSKIYAVQKLDEALSRIDEFEKLKFRSKLSLTSGTIEPSKSSISSSEMALLLSLPPPPPPDSPPPISISSKTDDPTLQLFYAQLNSNANDSTLPPTEESTVSIKYESSQHHQHPKEKKTKPAKTLPTSLIQKWTHARQELHGVGNMNDS